MAAGSDGPGESVGFSALTGSGLSVENDVISDGSVSVSGAQSVEGNSSVFRTAAVSGTDSVMLEAGTSIVLESESGSARCWQPAKANSAITSAIMKTVLRRFMFYHLEYIIPRNCQKSTPNIRYILFFRFWLHFDSKLIDPL